MVVGLKINQLIESKTKILYCTIGEEKKMFCSLNLYLSIYLCLCILPIYVCPASYIVIVINCQYGMKFQSRIKFFHVCVCVNKHCDRIRKFFFYSVDTKKKMTIMTEMNNTLFRFHQCIIFLKVRKLIFVKYRFDSEWKEPSVNNAFFLVVMINFRPK